MHPAPLLACTAALHGHPIYCSPPPRSYFGPLGFESSALIAYLEAVPGVQAIRPGSNPATWCAQGSGGAAWPVARPISGRDAAAGVHPRLQTCPRPRPHLGLPQDAGGDGRQHVHNLRDQPRRLPRGLCSACQGCNAGHDGCSICPPGCVCQSCQLAWPHARPAGLPPPTWSGQQASTLRRQNDATAERLVEEGQAAHQPLAVPTQYAASFW